MADIDLKTETPDTSLPTTGFLFGADSQAAASPSVFTVQSVATTLLGSTTLTGATITADAPVFNMSQTWNAGGVTFTGLKYNATDTASAAASLLMDLQVGGASRFNVSKVGNITAGSGHAPTVLNMVFTSGIGGIAANGVVGMGMLTTGATTHPNAQIWGLASAASNASDTFISRRAAANLRLGAADAALASTVAQTLSVQSVTGTDASAATRPFTITGAQGTGTGAGGSIVFQVAPAGSSGTAQNALATALTITSARAVTVEGAFTVANGSGATITGGMRDASSNDTASVGWNGGVIAVNSTGRFEFTSGATSSTGAGDVRLYRDAANTLALRNGTAAQALRVYNTFTDATTFERANIFWDSNVLKIGTEKGSVGGTARALELQTNGTTRLTIATGGSVTTSTHIFSGQSVYLGTNGYLWMPATRSGITSNSNGTILFVDAAGTDFGRLQFGGTTSSFPALKRSSATLQARLADDSAFAFVQGKITTETAYTAGDPTTTGYLVIYDSTGTAYRVPAVLN